ncbi:MAG: lipid II flippase MurJ, partial [Roseovarius gahaiensis]
AFSRPAEISLALTVPCAVALIAVPIPLISVLFERGAFGADDTAATALAVAIYGLGLPAFVLQKILQPLFFAREDTKSPFRYAVVAMIVNAVLAVGLAFVIGWIAAAIATTVAGWAMVWLLMRGARQFGDVARLDNRFRRRVWRIGLASVLMGVIVWGMHVLLNPFFGVAGLRWLALLGMILAGIISYFGIGHMIGAFRLSEFRSAMRR